MGVRVKSMTDLDSEEKWWSRLSAPTQNRLKDDPQGDVPSELVPELVKAGTMVSYGGYFEAQGSDVGGWRLSARCRAFVESKKR